MKKNEPAWQWWKFSGANLQAVYGNGTRAQAEEYARYLNRNRDINLYGVEAIGEDDAEATRNAGGGLVDIAAEGVMLDAEISAIDPREMK